MEDSKGIVREKQGKTGLNLYADTSGGAEVSEEVDMSGEADSVGGLGIVWLSIGL